MASDWISLAGGLALFTFGLSQTSEALGRIASGWIKTLLLQMTRNPLGSVALGLVATLLAGSSSAITVMAVGFVSTGLLALRQAIEVMLGAGIGTTLTVQLVSFHVIRYAPLLIFAGVLLHIVERGRGRGHWAPLLLGFGFIFYGMMVMIAAIDPLARLPWVRSGLLGLDHIPLLAFVAALLFTAFIQNSATTIALAISFQIHGLITVPVGFDIVLGANVGSTAAAVYSALLGKSRSAKRAALAYFIIKASGALLFLAALPWFSRLVLFLDPRPARTLANAHTLFNIINALLFLPLAAPLARQVTRWLPDIKPVPVSQLDPNLVGDPPRALSHTQQEIGRMAHRIADSIITPLAAFVAQPDDQTERALRDAEADVDLMHHAITRYLFRVAQVSSLSGADRDTQIKLLYLANHLEHLSDTVMKVVQTRMKLSRRNFVWSPPLWDAMAPLLDRLTREYDNIAAAISEDDDTRALAVVQQQPQLLREEAEVRLWLLTHGDSTQSAFVTLLLELSDDLAVLIHRIAAVGRAWLGIV